MKRLPFIYKKNNKIYSITSRVFLSSYIDSRYYTYCFDKKGKVISKYEKNI